MATKNFRSTVLEPTSEFAHGDKLRFTSLATVGEVLKGSFSETTIGEDGVYSVDLQYGKHRIDYKPYEGVWRHFADVEVSSDTLATTLQDLALASVPVTDETVLVLQGILADAEAAKAESAAIRDEAAASAAAAAADAAKLADVTPDSIGAVSNVSGNTVFKPEGGNHQVSAASNFVKIVPPSKLNTLYSIQIAMSGLAIERTGVIFVNFYAHVDGDKFMGVSADSTGGSIFDVDFCMNEDGYFLVVGYKEAPSGVPADVYANIVNVIAGVQGSGADLNNKGWVITSYTDHPSLEDVRVSVSTNTVSPDVIRDLSYNSKTYSNVRIDDTRFVGIPDSVFNAALAEQHAADLFESEKYIALQIFADFNLGTGEHEITGSDIADVRAYIQSIDPAKGLKAGHLQRAKIPRPSVFDRYK